MNSRPCRTPGSVTRAISIHIELVQELLVDSRRGTRGLPSASPQPSSRTTPTCSRPTPSATAEPGEFLKHAQRLLAAAATRHPAQAWSATENIHCVMYRTVSLQLLGFDRQIRLDRGEQDRPRQWVQPPGARAPHAQRRCRRARRRRSHARVVAIRRVYTDSPGPFKLYGARPASRRTGGNACRSFSSTTASTQQLASTWARSFARSMIPTPQIDAALLAHGLEPGQEEFKSRTVTTNAA
jgi:hypothetical protein